jgi:acyl carrier protein
MVGRRAAFPVRSGRPGAEQAAEPLAAAGAIRRAGQAAQAEAALRGTGTILTGLGMYQDQQSHVICIRDAVTRPRHVHAGIPARQCFITSGGAVVATGESSEVAVRAELSRRQARSLVADALAAVIPGLRVGELDERQELYADLGLDSLGFVRLLIELEGKLSVQLIDEELMTIELVNVADLIDLVERISPPAAK